MGVHSSLIFLIFFVADDEDEHVISPMFLGVVDPAHEVVVGFETGDVIYNKDRVGISKVAWY
jgi:hypothetical protein